MSVRCVSVILFEDFNTLLSRYVALSLRCSLVTSLHTAEPHSATSLVRAVAARVGGRAGEG